jgi:C-terminal processing protease CtpA/Prc
MRHTKDYLLGRVPVVVLALAMIIFGAADVALAEAHDGKGQLGVMVQAIPDGLEEELKADFGVLVSSVTRDSPAAKAGIEKGDVIQYFEGEKIRRPSNLVDAVRETKPGAKAVIKLVRNGKKKKVTATIGELKARTFDFDWKDHKDFKFVVKGRAYLGVHLQPLNDDMAGYFHVKAGEGALVLTVEEDSPAHKAGVKSGDVIVKLGDQTVKGPGDASDVIEDMEKGDKLEITLIRHKKKKVLKAELAEMKGWRGLDFFKMKGVPPQPDKGHWHIRAPHGKGFHYYLFDDEFKERMKDVKEKVEKEMKKVKKDKTRIAEDSSI